MKHIPLEYIPDIIIGKLIQVDIVLDSATINYAMNQKLCLCIAIRITYEGFDEQIPSLVLSISRVAAECCLPYPQIHGMLLRIEAPAERFRTEYRNIVIQHALLMKWYAGTMSDNELMQSISADIGPTAMPRNEWRSLVSEKPNQSHTSKTPHHSQQYYAHHLERIPKMLIGKVQTFGLQLDITNIHRDTDGFLSLYAEFPIDEQTEGLKNQYILSVTQCAIEFLQLFPELQRLALWTRPEYDDKVAISSFWIARNVVLMWGSGELSDAELFAACRDYNP